MPWARDKVKVPHGERETLENAVLIFEAFSAFPTKVLSFSYHCCGGGLAKHDKEAWRQQKTAV